MSEPVDLTATAGLPFRRVVRVTDGKDIWAALDAFEVRMQVRAAAEPDSKLKFDFSEYLTKAFDGNDILISWLLSGSATRALKFGHYDLVLSDPGATDDKALRVMYGYLHVDTLVTSGV